MKKLKLTESQIKMVQEHEKTLGKKKVLKITKEHYDALFSVLNESNEVTNNFKKYGKDLGIKYESHPAEGSYVPQSEKENKKTHASFNEGVSQDILNIISSNDFKELFVPAIKNFINNPSQEGLDPIWVKMGLNWGDFIKLMVAFGIVSVSVVGGDKVIKVIKDSSLTSKIEKFGNEMLKTIKGEAKKGLKYVGRHVWNMLARKKRYDMDNGGAVIQDEGLTEYDDNLPAGAANDPNAPWNQEDGEGEEEVQNQTPYDLITYNDNIAILKEEGTNNFYVLDIESESKYFKKDDDIYIHINELYDNDMLMDYSQPLDLDMIDSIENSFELNRYFRAKLDKIKQLLLKDSGVDENTTTASVGGSYVTPKIWAKSKSDMKFGKKPMIKGGKMLKDPLSEIDKVKQERFVAEIDMYIFAPDKEHAIVEASEIAKLINKKYDASARVTKVNSKEWAQLGESISERTGQVSFDDCVELNNNKEAQEGGCSVGAVDNVVKVDETVLENVAKQTGKTISEVRDIILKHKTKK